jgi:hypothetical protein
MINDLKIVSWMLMPHACNRGYSGGRDQNCSSKLAWANSSGDPILKKTFQKKGLVEWPKM